MKTRTVAIDSLTPDPQNARKHGEKNLAAIKASLKKFGQVEPLVVNKRNNLIIGGNGRLEAMKALGLKEAAIVEVDLDNTQAAALAIALNRTGELAEWNDENLGKILQGLHEDGFDIAELGFDLKDIEDMGLGSGEEGEKQEARKKLQERFGVPPFSILDARQGYWQERKKQWIALGIKSEVGRGGAPGGSPRPAARLTDSGHTQRGDGRGKAL